MWLLLVLFSFCWASTEPTCRGLLIEPNAAYADVSDDDLLRRARRFFTVEVVPFGDPESIFSSIVILSGGPPLQSHRKAEAIFNEILVRYPVRVVGFKTYNQEDFQALRQLWLTGYQPSDPLQKFKMGEFDELKNHLSWWAEAVTKKAKFFRGLDPEVGESVYPAGPVDLTSPICWPCRWRIWTFPLAGALVLGAVGTQVTLVAYDWGGWMSSVIPACLTAAGLILPLREAYSLEKTSFEQAPKEIKQFASTLKKLKSVYEARHREGQLTYFPKTLLVVVADKSLCTRLKAEL